MLQPMTDSTEQYIDSHIIHKNYYGRANSKINSKSSLTRAYSREVWWKRKVWQI